jgi:3-oxoacyl-(acyl-carrier-protein) synthase
MLISQLQCYKIMPVISSGAAGAVEAIATITGVMNDIVPPTINSGTLDPVLIRKLKSYAELGAAKT